MATATIQVASRRPTSDLRILAVMALGVVLFGVVDGSFWRTLLTPTLAYRPAILFGLTLVFGWRGFAWSQLLFLVSFRAFLGWPGAVLVTPMYMLSHALGLVVAWRLANHEPWLSRERSTMAFLAGAVLAPAVPAILGSLLLPLIGVRVGPGLPVALDSWLRGSAGILTLAPALLVYASEPLKRWAGLPSESERPQTVSYRNIFWLSIEMAVWSAVLWQTVRFKARYGINVTYLTFIPPLAFTLLRGMRLAALALAGNAIIATTLWSALHWSNALSALDLRLLLAIYSLTILVLAAVVDDSERGRLKLAQLPAVEGALRESEERFRRVFEEGPLGLALVARDYTFFKVNSAFCQMVGYSEAELVYKTFADITHPDDLQANIQLAERLFRREIPSYRIHKRYVKKNGEITWINLTASMVRDCQGVPIYGIAMVEDITEMRRTQEGALCRQKLESLGTLAGGIAHDFNNLLGAIHAHAELAMTELDAVTPCKESLQAICDVTMRGCEIVRQLMIYAGTESAVVGRVDLSRTVEEILSLLRVSITKHAVIQTDLAPHLPAIRASAAQIRQIAMNLITNASDAIGDRDGVIRISTRRCVLTGQSAAQSSVELRDGDYVQLDVSDTGHGMSAQTQAIVFDPFFTTKSAGRGVGLAVVQGIVRSVGGAIRVSSEPGKGANFQILLPCDESLDNATGSAVSDPAESATQAQHGAVLVVEDEDQLRHAVVNMLSKSGFQVFEAGDGSCAIDLLRARGGEIDVILLDMTLPGASSQEIIAEAAASRPDIKVVLTSAYSREMLAGTVNSRQIRGFIRKPFQFGDLLKTLRLSLSA